MTLQPEDELRESPNAAPASFDSLVGPTAMPEELPGIVTALADFFSARVKAWSEYSDHFRSKALPRRERPRPIPDAAYGDVSWTAVLIAHDEVQAGFQALQQVTQPLTPRAQSLNLIKLEAALNAGASILGRNADDVLRDQKGLAALLRTRAALTALIDSIPPIEPSDT
ncbi:MAG: hypothetical protein K1X83_06220 [Oligoflexia bacterium]|nr:hypothetical protein [Oligoflexia bacterium]